MIEVGGFFGLLLLIANVWAIINIVQSRSGTGAKVAWTVFIIVLPFLGFIIWLFFGPRGAR